MIKADFLCIHCLETFRIEGKRIEHVGNLHVVREEDDTILPISCPRCHSHYSLKPMKDIFKRSEK